MSCNFHSNGSNVMDSLTNFRLCGSEHCRHVQTPQSGVKRTEEAQTHKNLSQSITTFTISRNLPFKNSGRSSNLQLTFVLVTRSQSKVMGQVQLVPQSNLDWMRSMLMVRTLVSRHLSSRCFIVENVCCYAGEIDDIRSNGKDVKSKSSSYAHFGDHLSSKSSKKQKNALNTKKVKPAEF